MRIIQANSETQSNLSTGVPGLSSSLPKTPVTPGRIGPSNTNRRATTLIYKRQIHNLNMTMPPSYVQIPLVPLTDTEVIVYFFQSISRPLVALRLYSRNWGPASIVEVLNDHREIEPPYLRNTCSVKCTTSIKRGKEKFGDDWERTHREVFNNADDVKATDLIHLTEAELETAVDYDVRKLCVGLKKLPLEGVDGGIFTRCVKYCKDNNAGYTMFNVWKLAADLQEGRTPLHPPSPLHIHTRRRTCRQPRKVQYDEETPSKIATTRHGRMASVASTDCTDSVIGYDTDYAADI